MKWKIVADSSSDMAGFQFPEGDIGFETAPLTLTVGDKVFVDDENIDTKELVTALRNYKGAAHSACPSPEAFAAACREADNCFILTITGALSGSYNSALAAKKMLEEENPARNICVIDSLATSSSLTLAIREIARLIRTGAPFEEICRQGTAFMHSKTLLFTSKSLDNLIKNGRVNRLTGLLATALNMRLLGCASEKGEVGLVRKVRGDDQLYKALIEEMEKRQPHLKDVIISHCQNLPDAEMVRDMLQKRHPDAHIEVRLAGGLNTFYAEDGGLLVGF